MVLYSVMPRSSSFPTDRTWAKSMCRRDLSLVPRAFTITTLKHSERFSYAKLPCKVSPEVSHRSLKVIATLALGIGYLALCSTRCPSSPSFVTFSHIWNPVSTPTVVGANNQNGVLHSTSSVVATHRSSAFVIEHGILPLFLELCGDMFAIVNTTADIHIT